MGTRVFVDVVELVRLASSPWNAEDHSQPRCDLRYCLDVRGPNSLDPSGPPWSFDLRAAVPQLHCYVNENDVCGLPRGSNNDVEPHLITEFQAAKVR